MQSHLPPTSKNLMVKKSKVEQGSCLADLSLSGRIKVDRPSPVKF
jgi:hypothetical protein